MIYTRFILSAFIVFCFTFFIEKELYSVNYNAIEELEEKSLIEEEDEKEDEEEEKEEEEEEEPWSISGDFSQVFNQASFTNWAAGGESSFNATSAAELEVNYEKDNLSFENYLDLRYGIYKTEGRSIRKSDDRIDFTSKFGRKITEKLSSSFLLNYRSQFTPGYDYSNDEEVISRFMAPGYTTISMGFDYKPWEFLSVFVSPASGRFTFVLDQKLADEGAFGVDAGENFKAELGGMVNLSFSKSFTENIRFRSRLEFFNAYSTQEGDGYSLKNSVINWQSTANIKITEYITMSLLLHMIYDHAIAVDVYEVVNGEEVVGENQLQIKQTMGLGFSYSF